MIIEHLLYQIIQLWIYEKGKNAGMLDSTAPPFFPYTVYVPEEPVEVDKSDDHNNTNITEQTTKHIESQCEIQDNAKTITSTKETKTNIETNEWTTVQKRKSQYKELPNRSLKE